MAEHQYCLSPEKSADGLVIDISTDLACKVSLNYECLLHHTSICTGATGLRVCGGTTDIGSDDTCIVPAALSKRRLRGSNRRESRRRSYCSKDDSIAEDSHPTLTLLQRLAGLPWLRSLERLFLCDIEELIPLQTVCLLVDSAHSLRELVLDNIIVEEAAGPPESIPFSSYLKRISVTCCGPAEETLLRWIMCHAHLSLESLDLSQMLLSQTTLQAVASLPALNQLHMERIPGAYRANLLPEILDKVKDLCLQDPMPLEYINKLFSNKGIVPSTNLQTLSLAIDIPLRSISSATTSDLFASILRYPCLLRLSLGFSGNHSSVAARPSDEGNAGWDHVGSVLARELAQNQCLESLELLVSDADILEATAGPALEGPLETALGEKNTSLSTLTVRSPNRTLTLPPAMSFYLRLNNANRRQWFHGDLTIQQRIESLVKTQRLFLNDELHQVSLIFHFLSSNPTSWASAPAVSLGV
jgi:hypothetical protein